MSPVQHASPHGPRRPSRRPPDERSEDSLAVHLSPTPFMAQGDRGAALSTQMSHAGSYEDSNEDGSSVEEALLPGGRGR